MTFHWICIYENPETSEVAEEFTTLTDALGFPARPEAAIISNGSTLAVEASGTWELTRAGREWQEFPESVRPKWMGTHWLSKAS